MWGGSMANIVERGNAAQAEMFVEQEKSFFPAIRPIRRVHIVDHFRRATFESFVAQNPPPPDYDNIVAKPSNQPSGAPPAFPVPNVAPSAEGDAEMSTVPLTASPQPQASTSSTAGIGMLGVQMPEPEHQAQSQKPGLGWGSRNPFAAAIAEQTRKLSVD
ncbi:unnamed protein product [Cyclocybe aegerita]|uniref:Uncharacterized protein n=1 Tax=Cyclocybe aegerita TaxID=1973307 RepID=A0A8S0XPK3_CYCAE|nr:unnamed protein product [Cyclocybe aegerita]